MPKRGRARKPIPLDSTPEERALAALALARREGISLTRASRLVRTDRRTVLRHAGQAFRRDGRRYVPTAYDRIPRRMTVLTPQGPVEVVVRDSRTATLLSEHIRAVGEYRDYGREGGLAHIHRRRLRVGGQDIELATDPVRIDRLAAGAELHYELYRH